MPFLAAALALALAPPPPQVRQDTTLAATPGLSVLPESFLVPRGFVTVSTGYVTPPGGGAEGGSDGSGNQTYRGEVAWGLSQRLMLMLGTGVNDDPTFAPIRGERLRKSWENLVLGARTVLLGTGRVRIGIQVSAELLWISGDPGIFNAGSRHDERILPAYALDLPVTWLAGDRVALTLTPSVARLPDRVLGAAFYGTAVRLGGAARVRLASAWTTSASGELVLGPGDNTLDRRGALRRLPTWRVGVRYRSTARVALEGYLTNMSGVTPATRHVTLPSTPTTLYGVGIAYTPSAPEAPTEATEREEEASRARGGVTIPSPITMPAGTGYVEATVDTEGGVGFEFSHALGRRFQAGLVSTRIRGPDAPAILEAPIGSGFQYRFVGELTLVDQEAGAPLSLAGHVSVGRDFDDQQGYLMGGLIAAHKIAGGTRLSLNPTVVQSGGRSPVSVAAGAAVAIDRFTVLPEWRVSLAGDAPVGALGVWLPPAGPLRGRVFVTNAGSTLGLGRMLADPGGYRAGATVRVEF